MARPRTPIGAYGAIAVRRRADRVIAETRIRDADGRVRHVRVAARTAAQARLVLKERLLDRPSFGAARGLTPLEEGAASSIRPSHIERTCGMQYLGSSGINSDRGSAAGKFQSQPSQDIAGPTLVRLWSVVHLAGALRRQASQTVGSPKTDGKYGSPRSTCSGERRVPPRAYVPRWPGTVAFVTGEPFDVPVRPISCTTTAQLIRFESLRFRLLTRSRRCALVNSRRFLQLAAVFLMSFPLVVSGGGAAFAYDTYGQPNDYHLTGGVYGREYYFFNSASVALQNFAYSGKWLWGNAMPGKVAWSETSNVNNAEMNFLQSTVDTDYCAETSFWGSAGNNVDPDHGNYAYTKVQIDYDFWNYGTPDLCTNQQGIVTHEIGHVMGIDHVPHGSAAIMVWDIAAETFVAPKLDDENGINHIYY